MRNPFPAPHPRKYRLTDTSARESLTDRTPAQILAEKIGPRILAEELQYHLVVDVCGEVLVLIVAEAILVPLVSDGDGPTTLSLLPPHAGIARRVVLLPLVIESVLA